MGIPTSIALPTDEGMAISIIGESFPPLHAFEAILLALTLHPVRKLSQCQVDRFFWEGIRALSPKQQDWDSLSQTQFQGWARLVPKGHEVRESENLAKALLQLWERQEADKLFFPEPQRPFLPSLPPETSFFWQDHVCDAELCCMLRPGWPARWVPLGQGDDVEHLSVLNCISNIWGTDPVVTICVRARQADDPGTILVDEVTNETVDQRLVLCEGTPAEDRAHGLSSAWVGLRGARIAHVQVQDTRVELQRSGFG